jgi:hypothetical protein
MVRNQIGMEYVDDVAHYLVEEIDGDIHTLLVTKTAWTGENMEIVGSPVIVKDSDYDGAIKKLNDNLSIKPATTISKTVAPELKLVVTDGVLEVKKAEDIKDVKEVKLNGANAKTKT